MATEHTTTNSPHPDWTSEDAAHLRVFLKSTSGGKLLGMLAQLRPGFTAQNVEAAALEGKVIAGWESCTELILRAGLLKPVKEVIEPVAYPDLDTDDGWTEELQLKDTTEPAVLESHADIQKTEG